MKVAAYEENGLQILHDCIATMMEHVIVQVVSGLLKAIDFQENMKKEFKTVKSSRWLARLSQRKECALNSQSFFILSSSK